MLKGTKYVHKVVMQHTSLKHEHVNVNTFKCETVGSDFSFFLFLLKFLALLKYSCKAAISYVCIASRVSSHFCLWTAVTHHF